MDNFIQPKFEDYNPGRASQKAENWSAMRSQGTFIFFLRQRAVH